MNLTPHELLSRLSELEQYAAAPARYVIAFSGGLDSTVLAAALHASQEKHGVALLAVHIDHQLHDESSTWAEHCRAAAAEWNIDFECRIVTVDKDAGLGPEAAARAARYRELQQLLAPGDWLLSAHHRDDQAETLLINLLRGSGPAGVAAIRGIRRFGPGWLARPLLAVPRESLLAYAEAAGLNWIEDPSNAETRFDRNFLRNEVLPLVETRWPNATGRLGRSADLARDAAGLLDELADLDLDSLGGSPERLAADGLRSLSAARQRNLLRRAVARCGLPGPGAVHVEKIVSELVCAREDAEPLVRWPGAEVRRYRDVIHLLAEIPAATFDSTAWDGSGKLVLGRGLGSLGLTEGAEPGLPEALVNAGLTLKTRRGGEEIKAVGQAHTRKLKKLLQDEAVLPWMRDRLPLLYSGERLVAVADLWIAAEVAVRNGLRPTWIDRPELH